MTLFKTLENAGVDLAAFESGDKAHRLATALKLLQAIEDLDPVKPELALQRDPELLARLMNATERFAKAFNATS